MENILRTLYNFNNHGGFVFCVGLGNKKCKKRRAIKAEIKSEIKTKQDKEIAFI